MELEQTVMVVFSITSIAFIAVVTWALIEVRRAMAEAQKTMTAVRGHLVLLIQEMRETTEQADGLVKDVRQAFEKTSLLWNAAGELGRSLERVQSMARDTGGRLTRFLSGLMQGAARGRGSEETYEDRANGSLQHQFAKRRSAND